MDNNSVLTIPRVEEFSVFPVDMFFMVSVVPVIASVGFGLDELRLLVEAEGPAVVKPGDVCGSFLSEVDGFSSGEVDGLSVFASEDGEGSSLNLLVKSDGLSLTEGFSLDSDKASVDSDKASVDFDKASVGYSLVLPVVTASSSLVSRLGGVD